MDASSINHKRSRCAIEFAEEGTVPFGLVQTLSLEFGSLDLEYVLRGSVPGYACFDSKSSA